MGHSRLVVWDQWNVVKQLSPHTCKWEGWSFGLLAMKLCIFPLKYFALKAFLTLNINTLSSFFLLTLPNICYFLFSLSSFYFSCSQYIPLWFFAEVFKFCHYSCSVFFYSRVFEDSYFLGWRRDEAFVIAQSKHKEPVYQPQISPPKTWFQVGYLGSLV